MKEIALRNGGIALVDDEDYERLVVHGWWMNGKGYVSRRVRSQRKTIYMHREILGDRPGFQIDHVNGNRADNQKSNLRHCTQSQNNAASRQAKPGRSSLYRGVHWCNRSSRFIAKISLGSRRIRHLGAFLDEQAAARAYDAAAREQFGEFASLNFPDDVEAFEAAERKGEEAKAS